MSIVPKNEKNNQVKSNRRRRKKRRTEDFSDSSDSSSSDGSDNEEDTIMKNNENNEKDEDIVLSNKELKIAQELNDEESKKSQEIKLKLKSINLTKTPLNESSKNVNLNDVSNTLKSSRKELEDEFLGLMFENYGDDINNLRSAPDFNERSLAILANVLKNGGNIFDHDTLKAVLNK